MAKNRLILIAGVMIGLLASFGLENRPKNNKLWMNPDTGYLVWTDKAQTGEFVVIENEAAK